MKKLWPLLFLAMGFSAPVVLVLDASGSMADPVPGGNEPKIDVAKEAARHLIHSANDQISLMVYTDCDGGGDPYSGSIRVEVPFTTDKSELLSALEEVLPDSSTPLADSILEAKTYLEEEGVQGAIIVLTDGEETCGGDVEEAISEALSSPAVSSVHVVGFGLEEEEEELLREEVESAGGTYYTASDAAQLQHSLRRAYSSASGGACCCAPGLILLGIFVSKLF